uniref:Autophagy related 2B n=1 Tax=Gouania willdenowi TaxID=441366 RepID=A0A8C5EAK6_GOUWI
MPWPFSESIKKRACRYLLHRYLGNFLEEKLSLDQLSLDLYQGTGTLAQVPLDKWSLNELLENADAPVEVIAGFIKTISLTVPWAALLQENCALEVKGLEMVLRPRPRVASGSEPMYWSSFMTSSMQLAKECLSQNLTDDLGESFQPFEGLEKFAETIETVLRRVKVTFLDTVLRIEHIPENSKTGIALEMRISKIIYCDETSEESSSVNVHQPTTFAHKNVQMEGISVFWEEFSDAARNGCKSSPPPMVGVNISKFSMKHWNNMHIYIFFNTLFIQVFYNTLIHTEKKYNNVAYQIKDKRKTTSYPSKAHGDESRPELVFKMTLSRLALFVLHIDPLPPPHAAPGPLGSLATHFFSTVSAGQLAQAAFLQCRSLFNQACPYDHLRCTVLPSLVRKSRLSPAFGNGKTCKIGSLSNTYFPHCTCGNVVFNLPVRLPDILCPSAFFKFSHKYKIMYSSNFVFLQLLQHKAFTEVFLDDGHTPNNCQVSLTISTPMLGVTLCFPIPDLRSDQERGPWFKKSLQKEVLYLDLEDLDVKTEFMGGNSPNQTKMELTFKELVGMSLLTNGTLVLWIEEEGAAHSLKDVCDFGKPEPSPFSSRRVMYENEEMVIPGDAAEMTEFQEKSMNNSRYVLELSFPNVQLVLPNKAFYEKLHNRYEDIGVLKNKHGEFWMEVKNAILFSVTQYEGYKDQHYLCFHTSSVCMHHQGKPHQEFLVAVGVRGATLQHRVVPPSLGWYEQIVDFLNVSDEPVLGYAPPTAVTTLHLHLWSCSLDYKPLYLPLRSLVVIETFSISSSVSLDHSSSTLRIILDEAALFLTDKNNTGSVNLAQDYVQVLDMGTLELRITAVKPGLDGKLSEPRFELRCSSDVIHIRTCSDSCAALMNLIQYVACYGDLLPPAEPEAKHSSPSLKSKVSSDAQLNNYLQTSLELRLRWWLSNSLDKTLQKTSVCVSFQDRNQEPIVKQLSSDTVEILDDHFSKPLEGSPSSRGALNFPIPEVRYLIKEISVIWHLFMFFNLLSRVGGGRGRNPDVLMEIQLSKVKFQHEVYPPAQTASCPASDQPVSRQVFTVQDLEIRDRLATSQINKFLYLYSSKEMPRKAHFNMLSVKALHMCPESSQAPPECCLRVSLMPLRLNIDQDALFFLKDFFTSLTNEPAGGSQEAAPIISVPAKGRCKPCYFGRGQEEANENESSASSLADQPIFFRSFRFTSEVPIRLDYHGKHMSMDQGTFAGIVFGLTQLNCSELKLRQLCYRQGLLGVDKLCSYALNEWLNDIKANQLQGLLSGVAPIHTLVKLVHGLRDLVWLPIEQYRKDGRIVRGFQRGTASFGTSTAMAALELTNRMVRTIQAAAETAYDMVSPVPDEGNTKRIKRYSQYGLAHQPVDLREGVANAYTVVKEGITDTALTIYDTATREHEQRGITGAVGGVLRELPPAVVKPLIMATEATSNVLGGMRNQIHPDARQEDSQKWRQSQE